MWVVGWLERLISSLLRLFSEDPSAKRERELLQEFGLVKDPRFPTRYWIDGEHYIHCLVSDERSYEKARGVLMEYYRNPGIVRAENADILEMEKKTGFPARQAELWPRDGGSGGAALALRSGSTRSDVD